MGFVLIQVADACYPLTSYVPIRQDCTSLPSVADVAGIASECVVHRCIPGYVPARDGIHCVSRHGRISPHPEYDEDEAESVPATVYGLEHVPLRKRKHRTLHPLSLSSDP
jgi:hypothetical protein